MSPPYPTPHVSQIQQHWSKNSEFPVSTTWTVVYPTKRRQDQHNAHVHTNKINIRTALQIQARLVQVHAKPNPAWKQAPFPTRHGTPNPNHRLSAEACP
eukprot:5078921-Prymnesium_polylepis.1